MKSESFKITIGYIVICLIWGSTWLVIRMGLDSITPILGAGLRFLLAAILTLGVMRIMGARLQKDRQSIILYCILCVFSYVLPFSFVYWGEKYVPSGLASILFATFPLFIALISWFLIPNDKISLSTVIGIIFGFIGIIFIFSDDLNLNFSINFTAMLVIVISSLLQAFTAVIIKRWGKHLNPVSMNFIPIMFAGIIMIIIALLFEDTSKNKYDFNSIFSVCFLALFGTVIAFTTYYWLLKRMSVVILSLSSFITPIIAVILGWIFLDEVLDQNTLIGSLLVLIGVLFANFNGAKNYYYSKIGK